MGKTIFAWCNGVIASAFYALFFFVPLVFTSATSELFEFNKMWLTYGLTIIIAAAWLIKMILQRKILLCRTPLDIPIFLFLVSQIISTIFSLDTHVSLWGYYSRFNGGLLSTITYIFLYYAFVNTFFHPPVMSVASNMQKKKNISESVSLSLRPTQMVKRMITASILGGLVVAIWGLPSHFGYDPTCFIFRGNFDVNCWTDAFQPKVRIFSTIGQPAWLGAYLAVLIPITIGFLLYVTRNMQHAIRKNLLVTCYMLLVTLFYVDLLFTRTRSAFIAIVIALLVFIVLLFLGRRTQQLSKNSYKTLGLIFIVIVAATFFIGSSLFQLDSFSYAGLKERFTHKSVQTAAKQSQAIVSAGEFGGTDSGQIRLIVWRGAIDAWKHNPIFGTGVETFAFAYYLYRPVAHNLTSEWDYLYNKAHNEYLNYLTTTGLFGLGSYLLMVGVFLFMSGKHLLFNISHLTSSKEDKSSIINDKSPLLVLGLLCGYITILITNFFGFSVVPINIFFYLIPAFVFILANLSSNSERISFPLSGGSLLTSQWIFIAVVLVVSSYSLVVLYSYWQADVAYARGYNLDRVGEYEKGYPYLFTAMSLRKNEPTYKDELSVNNAILAQAFFKNKDATSAANLANNAVTYSKDVVSNHPNNVTYWKTQVRVFFALSLLDEAYLQLAVKAIENANALAPTDAKVVYNLGLLYGQTGDVDKAIQTLEKTVKLKPDYKDAYFALGLYYRQKAVDKNDKVIDAGFEKKAVDSLKFILKNLDPNDTEVKNTLQKWKET